MVLRKVVPPAENVAFFVTTNVVITPNQTLGYCPEVSWSSRIITIGSNHVQDPGEVPQSICQAEDSVSRLSSHCMANRNLIKSKNKEIHKVEKLNLFSYLTMNVASI